MGCVALCSSYIIYPQSMRNRTKRLLLKTEIFGRPLAHGGLRRHNQRERDGCVAHHESVTRGPASGCYMPDFLRSAMVAGRATVDRTTFCCNSLISPAGLETN